MRVKVLYFGVLRDRFGSAGEAVDVQEGITAGDLLQILRRRTSNEGATNRTEPDANQALWQTLAVAVNREYAPASMVLREGDEVALLPPVSGGCGTAWEFDVD